MCDSDNFISWFYLIVHRFSVQVYNLNFQFDSMPLRISLIWRTPRSILTLNCISIYSHLQSVDIIQIYKRWFSNQKKEKENKSSSKWRIFKNQNYIDSKRWGIFGKSHKSKKKLSHSQNVKKPHGILRNLLVTLKCFTNAKLFYKFI